VLNFHAKINTKLTYELYRLKIEILHMACDRHIDIVASLAHPFVICSISFSRTQFVNIIILDRVRKENYYIGSKNYDLAVRFHLRKLPI
jgi:hypothetical protein